MELPTTKLVMLARDAANDEKNPLVEVLLVAVRLVEKRFVLVLLVRVAFVAVRLFVTAFVLLRLVVKKLVEVPLVITEEDAKMFCVKRLRNLLREVPSVYVTSV